MKIEFASKTVIGRKDSNDDRILIDGKILDNCSHNGFICLPIITAICDGCGGYKGGNIAAESVLELLSYEKPGDLADASYLSQVLDNCQHYVMEKRKEMPQFSEMCTTIAGLVISESSIIVFHSGDSRVYRHDKWGLARMTKDHSVVQNMIDDGELLPEQASNHPRRNVITRSIGTDGQLPEIYVSHTSINPGEKYLLCSDGLWEYVDDTQINRLLGQNNNIQQVVDELLELALKQGADDNISICICSREGATDIQDDKPFILD